MNDRWGGGEQFLVVGSLMILLAWLTLLTNEIAQLADWPTAQTKQIGRAGGAIAIMLMYLVYQSLMSIYDFAYSDRTMMWRDSLAGVGFVAFGIVVGGPTPILVGVAMGLMLQTQFIRQRVAPKIPDRYLRRLEGVVE